MTKTETIRKQRTAWVQGRQRVESVTHKPCAYDIEAVRLRLRTDEQIINSPKMKKWIKANASSVFIPEPILSKLKIVPTVN
jgi:hypothetical protein